MCTRKGVFFQGCKASSILKTQYKQPANTLEDYMIIPIVTEKSFDII